MPCGYTPGGARSIVWANAFGPGIVNGETSRFNGETFYTEVKIEYGEFVKRSLGSYTWDQEAEREAFEANFTQKIEWKDMTDKISY